MHKQTPVEILVTFRLASFMISKAKVRFIKSLQVKKYRLAEQCFLVQGAKVVKETLASEFKVVTLLATAEFVSSTDRKILANAAEVIEVSAGELASVGSIDSNDAALAVVQMRERVDPQVPSGAYGLLLDDIRDPGNLGTIIRTADWYGVRQIIASPETTDLYNPKVINASMGSFLRVNLSYTILTDWILSTGLPVYGAFLDGADIHSTRFEKAGVIAIGNESRGISPAVEKLVRHRVTIPRYGKAESLNASAATAVILDNLRRSQ
jgi:TrmH family RNA methyltransferase